MVTDHRADPAGWSPTMRFLDYHSRVWTALRLAAGMMRLRGLAAGHADLAGYVVKAVRKERFQWVE